MSAIFQRPLCDMGKAYEFAFRAHIGDADPGAGGPCDDRPRRVDLYAADADARSPSAAWRSFSLCPEHEGQLRTYDDRLRPKGIASRFRAESAAVASAASVPGGSHR
ncbi:MAG TPA: hypothetical protein VMF04_05155 [Thermoplasmata archaeon]|nr:hypothetical protein [Thermoplasmata archaeon]